MAKLGTMNLKGDSGTTYSFNVYDTDTAWKAGFACVYYISKRTQKQDGGGTHTAIYIGETEDLDDRLSNHHKQSCFDRNNYNAVSVHGERGNAKRLEIEADLIESFNPTCND